jgi:alpha-ketoglutarate-dependent taurine dioxygenase
MDEGATKARLIDWARRERAGWELLLADVGETHELPLPAVLDEARQVWDRLEEGLTLLPEQALSDPAYYSWTNGEALGPLVVREATAHFHQDHEAAVRSWLAGFQAPVDEG